MSPSAIFVDGGAGLQGHEEKPSTQDGHIDLDFIPQVEEDMLEPIAVVGFSFKFPQEATSTEDFWQMLMQGRCAATEFPDDRLGLSAIYHPDANREDSVFFPFFFFPF